MTRPIGSVIPIEKLIANLPFDFYDAVRRYKAGEGLQPLAKSLGTSQNRLKLVFIRAGIPIRGRSSAMRLRMKQLGKSGRQAITAAAHKAVKGRKRPPTECRRIRLSAAKSKQVRLSFVGRYERELALMLAKRGLSPIPQKAVGSYNIDIAIFPVAVEIHIATNHPLKMPELRKRIKYLIKSGWWWVIYIRPRKLRPICGRTVDEIIAFLQKAQSNPTRRGEYRVIWGSGEESSLNGFYADKRSRVTPPVDSTNS